MRRFGIVVTAAVLFSLLAASQSHADTNWKGTTGDWHDPLNWDNGVPTLADYAYIDNGGTAQISANAESDYQYTGYNNSGAVEQTDGAHTVSTYLFLGYESDSSGTYSLGGTGQLSVGYDEYIGCYGTGEFIQDGGTNTLNSLLCLGWCPGSSGTYTLSAEELYVKREAYIGYHGTGEFNHTGGTHTVSKYLYLGHYRGSSGTYSLSGMGELSVGYSEFIGYYGTGEFSQTGGIHTVSEFLYLGRDYASGTYDLSAGELSVGYNEIIGHYSTGEFIQTGGIHTVSGYMYLGRWSGSGTYNLSAGELSVGDDEVIGRDGTGEFNQTGGTNHVVAGLAIGTYYSGTGIYNIGGGFLEASDLVIGSNGTFNVTNNAASISIGNNLTIAKRAVFSAVPGTTIHMTGSTFYNLSTSSSEASGLWETTFIFEGGIGDIDTFEIAGMDYGEDGIGFSDNFALGGLILGGVDVGYVQLVENNDNGNRGGSAGYDEALYLRSLTMNSGSTLDLNGYHLYTLEYIDNGGAVLNGQINVIPEPATIALISAGLLGLASLKFRRAVVPWFRS